MRNAITLFQACLKKFEGSVSFHNFHRLSGRELRDTNSAYKRKMAISNPNAKTDWTSLTALKLSPQQGCDFEDEHEDAYAQSEWDDEESTAAAESDIDSEHIEIAPVTTAEVHLLRAMNTTGRRAFTRIGRKSRGLSSVAAGALYFTARPPFTKVGEKTAARSTSYA